MKIPWLNTVTEFFREVKGEMKKVSWPTWKEVWGTTLVTIVATLVLAVYLYIADLALGKLVQYVYMRLGA